MDPNDQLQIDFGDETLNDPQYEQKVQDDGTLADTPPDNTQEQGGDAGAAPQPDATQQQPAAQPTGAEAGAGGAPNQQGQQQQPAGQQPAPAKTKTDKDGNIVDDKGNVVAQAGADRRAFERVQAQDRVIRQQDADLQRLNQELAQARALNDAPQKLGLTPADTQMGLQAIAAFKKDPVSTARWMLQETMRLGYDLKQIIGSDAQGQLNGGSLDLAAVRGMINDAVKPLTADRNAQQVDQQANADAQREYDRFMANHDHAAVQEEAIASLVKRNGVTPEVAYWQLREYAAVNSFDFTKPLGPQVAARHQGGQQQPNGNATPQAQTPQQQPMPNGGGVPQTDMQQGPVMHDADTSWDAIVNQSLQEAGMNR